MSLSSETNPISVRYVLYSHFFYKEDSDFSSWQQGRAVGELEGIRFLVEHFKGLRELLSSPSYEGLLVLFYAPGLPEWLDGLGKRKDLDTLLRTEPKLQFARAVSDWLDSEIARDGDLSRRFRFVTALDLYPIFNRLNEVDADSLRWWFVGPGSGIRYDVPKIVEAIVRLRLLGNGVPVLRVDWDVLFRGDGIDGNKDMADLGMFKAVTCCLKAHRLRLDEPTISSFIFSASYDRRGVLDPNPGNTFFAWRGAFATRVFPALPVKAPELARTRQGNFTWEDYAETVFDPVLALRFYGFKDSSLTMDCAAGLAQIGAHPRVSVISGAFLCLSEGAILDLPPFSNFGLNVSWIDDHLKYSLHRELRHFTAIEFRTEPLLSGAKLDNVMVSKSRAPITNLPQYVLGSYIPTVLWGCIMDAWMTPDPLLKCRVEELSEEHAERWKTLPRSGTSRAPLPAALQEALRTGRFMKADRFALRERLREVALRRINEVRGMWASLAGDGVETFASIWAKGEVTKYFPDIGPKCQGISPQIPVDREITQIEQMNSFLLGDFDRLVDDAQAYIEWTLNWPKIVQVVRSIEEGTLRTDISWRPSAMAA